MNALRRAIRCLNQSRGYLDRVGSVPDQVVQDKSCGSLWIEIPHDEDINGMSSDQIPVIDRERLRIDRVDILQRAVFVVPGSVPC